MAVTQKRILPKNTTQNAWGHILLAKVARKKDPITPVARTGPDLLTNSEVVI